MVPANETYGKWLYGQRKAGTNFTPGARQIEALGKEKAKYFNRLANKYGADDAIKKFVREAKVNINRIPFRVPSGLSFVKINPKTGHQSNQKDSILEPYLIGNEPFNNKKLNVLDSLGAINNDSISGTGSLLDN